MLHSAILPHHTKWFQLFEQLRLHRRRRAAHLPRRVRQPRRQRPPPAAADLRPLRQPPGHRLLLGDHRQSGRARDDADRPAGRAHRPQRRAGRRAPRRPRRSADPPPGERRPRLGGDARPALGPAVPAGRPPDDRLRPVADRGRDPADRAARVAPRELRAAQSRSAATAAATCRPSDGRSSAACATARSSAWSRTNALELGVDIGRLDVVDPGRLPGLGRRRPGSSSGGPAGGTGRASRSSSPRGAPVDQYVIHHPEFLLEGTPEEARLDPDNLHVLLAHLRAATFELPFEPGERVRAGAGRRPARVPRRGGPRPPGRRRPLVLVERELPGLGDLAPDGRARRTS